MLAKFFVVGGRDHDEIADGPTHQSGDMYYLNFVSSIRQGCEVGYGCTCRCQRIDLVFNYLTCRFTWLVHLHNLDVSDQCWAVGSGSMLGGATRCCPTGAHW
jgi:hypothetical protein